MRKNMTEEQKEARKKKIAQTKKTQEEAAEKARVSNNLKMTLEKCQKEVEGTTPTYTYSVGEKVGPRHANWKDLEILEILDQGRIFKININYHEDKKETPAPKIDYISHLNINPKGLVLSPSMAKRSLNRINFSNRDIGSLLHMCYSFGVDFEPEYQRGLVWNQEDNEKLIDSIMNEIEIGKFAFIENDYDSSKPHGGKLYTCVDGKQRFAALKGFYEDKFTYKGVTYSKLSVSDKRHFTTFIVAVGISRDQLSLVDQYEYFLRLNQSGQSQSAEFMKEVEKKLAKLKKEKE